MQDLDQHLHCQPLSFQVQTDASCLACEVVQSKLSLQVAHRELRPFCPRSTTKHMAMLYVTMLIFPAVSLDSHKCQTTSTDNFLMQMHHAGGLGSADPGCSQHLTEDFAVPALRVVSGVSY